MSGLKRSAQAMHVHEGARFTRRRSSRIIDSQIRPNSVSTPPKAESQVVIAHDRQKFSFIAENMAPKFNAEASMVLVGMRGAGKSTLAIMASSAMGRKVIDLETAFQSASGVSSADYKTNYGSIECYKQQSKVLQNILNRHPDGYVLVCSWINNQIQTLLQEFSITNPVILIIRDAEAIENLFNIKDKGKALDLLRVSSQFFRACTNFEFFNISETGVMIHESSPKLPTTERTFTPCLALKLTERHFLSFLSSIYPNGTFSFTDPAFPLARIAIEERQFTYAAAIPLSNILSSEIDIEKHIAGSDVIQITLDDLQATWDARPKTISEVKEHSVRLADNITRGLGKTRRNTILPIMVHIALLDASEEYLIKLYLNLLHHTIRLAPEMITIDLRLEDIYISQVIDSCKRIQVVGNYFAAADPPSWDSPAWLSWYKKANRLGCHMARLTRPALSMEDNFVLGHLRWAVDTINGPKIPLTAYNTGPLGRTSTTFNRVLTVVNAGSPTGIAEMTTSLHAPPITALQATQALFSCFVYEALKFYVFGAQVDYSLSPAMLKSGFKACGIPHDHQPCSSSSLQGVEHLIKDPYFGGASVGLPYKIEIVNLTHSLSKHAEAIGAVNTLIPIRHLNEDGSIPEGADFFRAVNRSGPVKAIYGENTDWIGIRACIRRGLSPANAATSSTCGLVIGAGGMARATIYAMLQLGIKNIVIYNRTPENARKIILHFTKLLGEGKSQIPNSNTIRFQAILLLDEQWPDDYKLPTVIISCIPTHHMGDEPAPNFTLPDAWLGSSTGGLVIDMGYKTLNSPLLIQVRKESSRGWVSMDGLDILPEQGFAQFELFTGRRAPRKIMRRGVLEAYRVEEGDTGLEELQARLQCIDEKEEH